MDRTGQRDRFRGTLEERFWRKVQKTATCWLWTGSRNKYNYGRISAGGNHGKDLKAHRVAYELVRGQIPEGLELHHQCANTLCVNPDHLEPMTHRENIHQGPNTNAVRRFCRQGHEFTEANTRITKTGRRCRACDREKAQARKEGRPARVAYHREVPRLTHCKRGHAFDETNTMISKGMRYCRRCACDRRRHNRAIQQERKAVA